jgi:hypothetical protein
MRKNIDMVSQEKGDDYYIIFKDDYSSVPKPSYMMDVDKWGVGIWYTGCSPVVPEFTSILLPLAFMFLLLHGC